MTTHHSFELYAYKDGNWNINSVYEGKQQALFEAELLFESQHVSGVKVIQEKFEESSSLATSTVIFSKIKGAGKPEPKKQSIEKQPSKGVSTAPSKPASSESRAGSSEFVNQIIKLTLILGGLGLGGIALVMYYLAEFGS